MQSKVEICGVNTASLTVIPADEMSDLLRQAHDGNAAAREKLIRGNLRLVLSVIQRFHGAASRWTICFRSAASV